MSKKMPLLLSAAGLLVVAAALSYWLIWRPDPKTTSPDNSNPVPLSIRQAVSFPVYYPDQQKLPSGYNLNTSSFGLPVNNGVSYSVSYGGGKKIVFSVQAKPSESELQTFNSSYIPLRIEYETSIGQAKIGAYQSKTLVSLPVMNGPWIIITAPADINQDQLKSVLQSIRK